MQSIDKRQQLAITLIVAGGSIITAIIGVMAYIDNLKHQKVEQDLSALNKELKLLQIAEAKNKANGTVNDN